MPDTYAEEREANILRNKQLLLALGLDDLKPVQEPKEKSRKGANKKRKALDDQADWNEEPVKKTFKVTSDSSPANGTRRSGRLAGKASELTQEQRRGTPIPLSLSSRAAQSGGTTGSCSTKRQYSPKTYGHIPGVEVGSWWETREECSNASVHAPWVAGIAPGEHGAFSIALSGGYDDDVDDGYAFTYTGSGGRDLKGTKAAPKNLRTAEQSSDQSFDNNFNRSLKRSEQTGKPVRVIRGFKLKSKYGPSFGYRYDGLYTVKKSWMDKGLNAEGFLVCKFAFVRQPGQPDLPVKDSNNLKEKEVSENNP
ncbi:PUA-like domain-containing protein [Hygrophoropsis aurantiaca]|uniref:PUA-like domain-containing protein n=1 Tax=Hygrophoropsis aurantiaca TaxID=72124 RepID=A0ACB8AS24_9AGAM|nr:PUA-like domain-containing protein [Hygrophoropsis aurantiaca]